MTIFSITNISHAQQIYTILLAITTLMLEDNFAYYYYSKSYTSYSSPHD